MGSLENCAQTNTASWGGFPEVNDNFASALWAVDYSLQTLARCWTLVVRMCRTIHLLVTAPTNLSLFEKWAVGPVMYATLFVTEALGTSNTPRVVDLHANDGNEFTPAYAIDENDGLSRIA
ncbi:hypothetical protein BD309DRAFT_714212 [Dichomitus squalens]|nr:hypothetical protein BD309DRAFT_714212 [Dichomitus squalens]